MVTADEMVGLQGWLIRRVGGFAINTRNPKASSLRHGIDILQQGEALVIFPEGDIYRQQQIQPLKSGLAWLALHAEASYRGLGIKIVPISLHYSDPMVPWRSRVSLRIGSPLEVANYNLNEPKQSTRQLTAQLQQALEKLAASHCAPKPKY
jgi:1-acyl-sn-glycerol-3-phosphate acyltransferase